MVRKSSLTLVIQFFLLLLFLTTPIMIWQLPTVAQIIPGLNWSENDINSNSNIPMFSNGNLEIAPVFLDGKVVGTVESFIELKSDKATGSISFYNAATRSHWIHSKLQKILDNMSSYSRNVLYLQGISEPDEQKRELREQLVTSISEENGNKVVLVTFPKDDVPEIVFTVTPATIERPRFGGSQPLKIAERTSHMAKNVLIEAWKERQTPHLLSQAKIAILALMGLIAISLVLRSLQQYLKSRQRILRNRLSEAETIQPQAYGTSNPLSPKFQSNRIKSYLQQKLSLNQRHSLNALYRSGLFWSQWLLWTAGIGYITSLFYWSRPLSNWIVGVTINGSWSENGITNWPPIDWFLTFGSEANLGTPLFVLFLCFVARLTLKGGNVLCDFLASHWSKTQSSERNTLRNPTLASILKGWLNVIIYLLVGMTVLYHLHQLGAITQLVAIFLGFFSFAVSLASQNLLKDLIGGLLILWEDQYAVGDVIVVNNQGGLVEKITLRVTQMRNLDGEFITIPNGSIDMVRNLTSEWSRVNYAIEVGYDNDVEEVLQVMEEVLQQLYFDPEWQEKILEAPEILGVDNISHTGILIRLIIKTKPLQKWSVGREFRRRLKIAFDQQGIKVGIPKQMMYINEPFPKMNNGNLSTKSPYES